MSGRGEVLVYAINVLSAPHVDAFYLVDETFNHPDVQEFLCNKAGVILLIGFLGFGIPGNVVDRILGPITEDILNNKVLPLIEQSKREEDALRTLLNEPLMKGPVDFLAECRTSTVVGGSAIGGPFELTDHTGLRVTNFDVIDGPTLMYFGYTFCPDVCPLDIQRNAEAVTTPARRISKLLQDLLASLTGIAEPPPEPPRKPWLLRPGTQARV